LSTKKSLGPLLYIHQPFARNTSSKSMQEVYTNRRELKPFEDDLQEVNENQIVPEIPQIHENQNVKEKPLNPNEGKDAQKTEVIPENSLNTITAHQKRKQRASLNRVKPFNELDLLERIHYLLNFPKVLPPVPCVFYVEGKNYQGYLADYNQHEVTIQLYDKTSIAIPIEELKNIMMIGIKR